MALLADSAFLGVPLAAETQIWAQQTTLGQLFPGLFLFHGLPLAFTFILDEKDSSVLGMGLDTV